MTKDTADIQDHTPAPRNLNDPTERREPNPREELKKELPTKHPEDTRDRKEAENNKVTQFDGNPNPQGTETTPLGPKDDTPFKLDKVEGPRNSK